MSILRLAVCGLMWLGLLGMASVRAADTPELGLVDLGFSDFRYDGYGKAFRTWAYGGPLEQDIRFAKRLEAAAGFWNALGRNLGYDDVTIQAVSSRSELVMLTAQFERGEVFFRFIIYRGLGRYSITSVEWSTDPTYFNGLRSLE